MHRTHLLGNNLALIVVDAQRKFSIDRPDWAEIRDPGVAGINRYARMFRKAGRPVIFMAFEGETHNPYDGDDGDEWLQGLEFEPTDIVVKKYAMSSFKGTELDAVLKRTNTDSVVIVGAYAELCVAATYFSATEHDYSSYIGKGAIIAWTNPGGVEATELMCGMATEELVKEKLKL